MVDSTKTIATVPAFTDSVDVTSTYSLGICGDKLITLDGSTPSFLSLSDATLDPFKVEYDGDNASESDVGISHTVKYAVSFKEYSGIPHF